MLSIFQMKTMGAAQRLRVCHNIFVFFCCWFVALAHPAAATTYTVTNVADSGAGSLRQAILSANGSPGLNTIAFNLAGTNPFTITPASAFPTITNPVVIDGTTQPGYAGTPLIEINGSSLVIGTDGLLISAGGSTVRGLAINRCPRDAIRLTSLGANVIQANFLGTDPSGTIARSNGEGGVMVYGSPGNLIGGTNASARNVISGGNQNGIYLFMSAAVGNTVQGNYIGTSITGLAALGNVYSGIEVAASSSNVIGGTSPGAGNVISGNGQSGIYFLSGPATGNVVQGNYIGVNASGTAALGNGQDAVTINGVSGNTIGGTATGTGNVLSGNMESGVFIWTAGATSNVVAGNYIGTDKTGKVAIPNYTNGVTLDGAPGNTIGGTNAGALNVISGNQQLGVLIFSAGASNNMVLGNYIGPDATGTNSLGNTYGGVTIEGVAGNVVGATNGRNVISGNTGNGLYLVTAGASNNIVAGNYIGTDATGEKAMPNTLAGVYIQVPGNTVGGLVSGAGNVISGNTQYGVFIYGTTTSNNVVEGNFIGTDATGRTAVENEYGGMAISNAPANTIGGTASGAGNVISGNANSGITLGGNTSGTVVQGNYIGTDLAGDNAVPNSGGGIYFYGSGTNLIGGAAPGTGNIISGNEMEGVSVGGAGANGNTIQGNFIGTKADGVSPLGNQWHNIDFLNTAGNNLVGGSTPAADNHIAFVTTSQYDGVRIRAGCLGNFVSRNSIFSNAGWGIVLGSPGVTFTNLVALAQAVSDGFTTGIQGSLSTYANGQFLIQFYENNVPNLSTPPGYGEGLIYLGSTNITTGASGQTGFVLDLPFGIPPGKFISATVTDSANTTWEFCADLQVQSPPSINILQSAPQTILVTNPVTHVVTTNRVPTITVSWPTNPPGFVLLCATNLNPPVDWSPATNTVSTNGADSIVTMLPEGLMSFYRLLFR
jgi:titin